MLPLWQNQASFCQLDVDRTLSEAAGMTLKAVEILREDAEERRQVEEYKARTDANLASLNAAVERLENLFSYLCSAAIAVRTANNHSLEKRFCEGNAARMHGRKA
jgi:hypothetical protein